MESISVPVKGMHCASCATTIKKALSKVDGVQNCEVNIATEKANIEFDPSKTNIDSLSKKIEPYGYTLINTHPSEAHKMHTMDDGTVMSESEHAEHLGLNQTKEQKLMELAEQKQKVEFVMPITIFIFIAMMWEILSKTFNWFPVFPIPMQLFNIIAFILATIVMFWIGRPFIDGVMKFLKYRVANMDTLIGIGTLTAYIYRAVVVLLPQVATLMKFPETTFLM